MIHKRTWDNDFRGRIHRAWYDFLREQPPGETFDQKWLAGEVGRLLGRPPFDQSTVSGWLKGRVPGKGGAETLEILAALAQVLGVQPGSLAFGGPLQRLEPDLEADDEDSD